MHVQPLNQNEIFLFVVMDVSAIADSADQLGVSEATTDTAEVAQLSEFKNWLDHKYMCPFETVTRSIRIGAALPSPAACNGTPTRPHIKAIADAHLCIIASPHRAGSPQVRAPQPRNKTEPSRRGVKTEKFEKGKKGYPLSDGSVAAHSVAMQASGLHQTGF